MVDPGVQARVSRLLTDRGWVASWGELRAVAGRAALRDLVASGALQRVARGRYAAPVEIPARLAAERVAGVASHRTAAAHHGLPMKWAPARPCVTVPRGRRPGRRGEGLEVSYRALPPGDIQGWVTTPLRTVLDCAATLPFDEALCIADSALRAGVVTPRHLRERAMTWPARGRQRVLRVATHADARSSGPIESVLRAICLQVPGLTVTPQLRIERAGRFLAVVDLADERLRIVIEAEGSSSTATATPSTATVGATTSSPWTGGWWCASPGSRSCAGTAGSGPPSPQPWPSAWPRSTAPGPDRPGCDLALLRRITRGRRYAVGRTCRDATCDDAHAWPTNGIRSAGSRCRLPLPAPASGFRTPPARRLT